MILTGWNCREVGNPRSVRCLRDLVKSRHPDFLFLSETLTDGNKISDLCGLLGLIRVMQLIEWVKGEG